MKLDRDRCSQISRESMKGARGLMRCPACLMVQECTLKGFTCCLTRCPRMFRSIDPPAGPQPVVRVEN